MNLYLMRHAESEDGDRMDPTRALTQAGHTQATVMAEFMRRQIGAAPVIITSAFRRAEQTAEPMAESLGCGLTIRTPALDPDSTAPRAWAEIRRIAGDGNPVVVSHHPLVGALLEYLTGAKTDEISFHHGHIAHVKDGRLRWFVGPRQVERDEEIIEAAARVCEAAVEAVGEGAHTRRDRALRKPVKQAAKSVRARFRAQLGRMLEADLTDALPSLTEAAREANRDDVEAQLRISVAGLAFNEAMTQLFDDALRAALAAAAAHTADDFAFSDTAAFATFESRYLAAMGFSRITGGIDATTIRDVARAVAQAYDDGANYQGIVAAIKNAYADFSARRADLIAQTELNNAYNAGIWQFGRQVSAATKSWHTTSATPCPLCVANEMEGRIPIDQPFSSGEDFPTAHPNCMCSLEVH